MALSAVTGATRRARELPVAAAATGGTRERSCTRRLPNLATPKNREFGELPSTVVVVVVEAAATAAEVVAAAAAAVAVVVGAEAVK